MTQTEWIISIDGDLKDYDELFVGNAQELKLLSDALISTGGIVMERFKNAHYESLFQACIRTAFKMGYLYAMLTSEDWSRDNEVY